MVLNKRLAVRGLTDVRELAKQTLSGRTGRGQSHKSPVGSFCLCLQPSPRRWRRADLVSAGCSRGRCCALAMDRGPGGNPIQLSDG